MCVMPEDFVMHTVSLLDKSKDFVLKALRISIEMYIYIYTMTL